MLNNNPLVYCDSAASMPVLPEVWHFLQNYSQSTPLSWGCNLSGDHAIAQQFQTSYDTCTTELFQAIHCAPSEWFWTANATESNEWALQIACSTLTNLKVIFLHPLAHPSLVLAATRLATQHHLIVETLQVDLETYQIDEEHLLQSSHTLSECLIALPYGDNEMGSIEKNFSLLKAFGWVHFDAAQSFAKISCNLAQLPCTTLACSGYKFGSLPALGGLYVRLRPRKTIEPLFVGGSQQNGFRAGTLPFLLIQSFCIAYQAWQSQQYAQKIAHVRTQLRNFIAQDLQCSVLSPQDGLPHILTFEVPEAQKDVIVSLKKTLAFSQGSACLKGQGSPALSSVGLSLERQKCLLRLGLSPYNCDEVALIKKQLLQAFERKR